jgi:hypothetical protein
MPIREYGSTGRQDGGLDPNLGCPDEGRVPQTPGDVVILDLHYLEVVGVPFECNHFVENPV